MKKEAPFISDITKKLNVERKVQCASCDNMFKYESELKVHVKRIHLKIKDFFCETCGESCSSKSNLNDHLATHPENKFPCYMCGVKLSRKINLIKHMKNLHIKSVKKPKIEQPTPEKLPCHLCGKLFGFERTLRKHVKKHSDSKTQRKSFSNSFKLKVLEKAKEVGVAAAREAFGIHENTIKG